MKYRFYVNYGFTLIELLISVTIIGLLAMVATFTAAKAFERSRDNRRKTDLYQISDALEKFYYSQRNYPGFADGCGNAGHVEAFAYTSKYKTSGADCKNSDGTAMSTSQWIPDMKNYLSKIPVDIKQNLSSTDYCIIDNPCFGARINDEYYYNYQVDDASQKFILLARLENSSDPDAFNNDTSCTPHILPYDFHYCGSPNPQPIVTGYPIFILH